MSGICGDCPEYERIIDCQSQENSELKRKLEKAVEALGWYSKHKIGVCKTKCGTGLVVQVATEALKSIRGE